MSKNWPVGLRRIAWSLLVASFYLTVALGPNAAMAQDKPAAAEKSAPVEEKAPVANPADAKSEAKSDAKPADVQAKPAQPAPAPYVTDGSVDTITGESAILRFQVDAFEGKNLQVAVFYGEKNGGTVQDDWEFNIDRVTYDKAISKKDYTIKIEEHLKPNTSYFYRILAKTSDGSTWSETGEFETGAAAAPWYMVAAILLGIVLLFVLPFLIGSAIAGRLKMPDHGWKIGLIIWSLAAAGVIVGFGWPPHLGIDLSGGVMLVYELEDDKEAPDAEKAAQQADESKETRTVDMEKLMGAMALRVNPGGTKEITLRQYGPRQVEITIPRASDEQVKRIERKISSAGTLEFRILANETDHSDIISIGRKTEGRKVRDAAGKLIAAWVPVTKGRDDEFAMFRGIATRAQNYAGEESLEILVVIDPYNVTGEYLAGTTSGYDNRMRPCVDFLFNTQGGHLFGGLTNDNLPDEVGDFKRQLGIILDGYLYSAPSINGPITTSGQITGDFTQKEVKDLVDVLNAGSLPAALKPTPISRLSTGPTLGHDMIIRGAWAIGISLVVVLIFMVFYYRFAGIVACFALLMTLLLLLAVMIAVKADFTLPGIAGLVLTVGMAVDANVLIFERIREELSKNAALRMAIRNGFGRATTTVVDANLTTLITATVLYIVGTEQIKGFAVTLWLGVVLSMYTAIFCSRVFFDVAERKRWLTKLSMLRMFGQTNIDFIGKRYVAATISIVLIVIGLLCVGARGKGLLDIDFTGGVSVQVLFEKPTKISEVRKTLSSGENALPDLAVADVQLFEGEEASRRFIVNTSKQLEDDKDAKGKGKEEEKSDIGVVEDIISKAFPGELATNKMEIVEIKPQTAAQATGNPAPAKKPAEKPAAGDQSRNDLPPATMLASTDDAAMLLAQNDTTKKSATKSEDKKPSAKAPAAKPEEKKPAAKTPAVKPEEKKPASSDKKAEPKKEAPVEKAAESVKPASGGSRVSLNFQYEVNAETLEDYINTELDKAGLSGASFGLDREQGFRPSDNEAYHDWIVETTLSTTKAKQVFEALQKTVASETYFPSSSSIGGRVAQDMQLKAIYALLASLLFIVGYIWVRFQRIMFGMAAVAALVHDVLITLGALAISYYLAPFLGVLLIDDFKIGLSVLAAFLTIIGYSLNDTIVVFDRIREVRGKSPDISGEMINTSVNQTLSRTVLTSLTTLIVVLILYIGGGQGIHAFAFSLLVGVVIGTYSSIFVASPILYWMGHVVSKDNGTN
ncbi:MAG: protein translocase subunit SecD [Pirellulales bacterium]|nr:protein translocase subunit SecD [Pirellulales bacterium]